MKVRSTIEASTQEHVAALMGRLRRSDRDEIDASSGGNPDHALYLSWRMSERCWTAFFGDEIVAVFGVGKPSLISEIGVPWMLGTENLSRAWKDVGRLSRQYVQEMRKGCLMLENHIDARQTKSIRWLKWCGFAVDPAEPWGRFGRPFHRFWMMGGGHV